MDEAAAAARTRDLLDDVLPDDEPRDFAVRLWDGSSLEPDVGRAARFTIVLAHPGALKAMFVPPTELVLGEAFVHGDFDVEGDLEGVFGLAERLLGRERGVLERARLAARLLALPVPRRERAGASADPHGPLHSPERDREAVTYHYDRSPEFFAAFLDRRLVYSCAYFEDAEDDLDTAQERKLDLLCRKLRLRPGERLLDVGCGFGALALHA
ncbi:MAG TPA: class I SAM-dependent methyltransferase, partial [Gaiellaceae bacterium]|nr:class I SAM-dependent methyltransferase [Gaiellaceae bacterium]